MRGQIKLAAGHRRAGHLERALAVASEVVEDLRRGSLVDHLASAWNVLGSVQRDLGSADADASFGQALELERRIGYRIELAHALHGLGRGGPLQVDQRPTVGTPSYVSVSRHGSYETARKSRDLRNKLNSASWGDANFPPKDSRWPLELDRAKPSGIPFNSNA